jgi:hypothetical protein
MTLEAELIAKYAQGVLDFSGLNLTESNFSSINLREHQKINYPILWDGHPARP